MNDAERLLIEYICDGDIKKSQAQVRTILESLNTEKDKRFKEYQLKKLNTKQAELIELPYNMRGLLTAENSALFPINRFILREGEEMVVKQLLDAYEVSNELADLNVRYVPSLLLHGESGTGKTALARYIAYKADLPFVYVKFSNLITSALGSTQNSIAKIFDYARTAPCVLCFDEIDAVGMKRGARDDVAEMGRVTIAIMQELDTLKNGVIIIGTTNRYDSLDDALIRRFQLKHKVKEMSLDDVYTLAIKFFNSVGIDKSEIKWWAQAAFKGGESAATVITKCTDALVSMLIERKKKNA